jgi:hypothetical protein
VVFSNMILPSSNHITRVMSFVNWHGFPYFLIDFFSFLVSLLDVGFKKNRLHGILFYLFYRFIRILWAGPLVWRVNLGGSRSFFFCLLITIFFGSFCVINFLFHLSIFNLLRIDLCGFLISSVFDQIARDTGFIS